MSLSRDTKSSPRTPSPPSIRVLALIVLWLILSIAVGAAEPEHQGNGGWLEWFFVVGTLVLILLATSTLSRTLSPKAGWILASLLGLFQGLQTGIAWSAGEASAAASVVAGASLALVATVGLGSALAWWHTQGGREWGMFHRRKQAPRWFLIGFAILSLLAVFVGALLASVDWP
jgi:hypothetical protein